MARTHAKLLTSIWSDQDFVDRTPLAQRMYMALLSQPKLSFVGVIDYVPQRWANEAAGLTVAAVRSHVAELEKHRFVVVDHDTAELLVRSFVRNDGVCQRWQMIKAMWSAWQTVASAVLRERIVAELPPEAWDNDKATPPANAIAIRDRIRDRQRQCPPDWQPDWQPDCQSQSQHGWEWQHLHLHLQPAPAG